MLSVRAADGAPATETTGVVLGVGLRVGGAWTEVELARCDGETLWVARPMIAAHLGRLTGVSRIDQPNKYIYGRVRGGMHGWFVRVYRGIKPYLTATFSDATASSMRAALKAALAFHAAHGDFNAGVAIEFV